MSRNRYDHTVNYVTGEIVASRRIPQRAQNLQSDFAVPFMVAVAIGVVGGLLVAVIISVVFKEFWTPFAIFMLAFTLGGFIWRLRCTDATIWASEQVAKGQQEPYQALPMPEVREPILLNAQASREQAAKDQRNADREAFESFVRSCEYETSARYWSNEPMYDKWRAVLMGQNYARWKNPNNRKAGWELSQPAEVIIERLSGQET